MSNQDPNPIPPEPNSTTGRESDQLYTISQAADFLHLSVTWLYERTRKATIPHHKMGKYIRFTESDLSAIIRRCVLAVRKLRWPDGDPTGLKHAKTKWLNRSKRREVFDRV